MPSFRRRHLISQNGCVVELVKVRMCIYPEKRTLRKLTGTDADMQARLNYAKNMERSSVDKAMSAKHKFHLQRLAFFSHKALLKLSPVYQQAVRNPASVPLAPLFDNNNTRTRGNDNDNDYAENATCGMNIVRIQGQYKALR